MLTKNQLEMIEERKTKGDALKSERKKYIDFTLRNYLKKQLDSMADIPKVLDALPKSQTSKVITAPSIVGILKFAIELIRQFGPLEIDDKANIIKKFNVVADVVSAEGIIKDASISMIFSRPATDEEIELRNEILTCIDELHTLVESRYDPKRYTTQELYELALPSLIDDAKTKGKNYQIYADSIVGTLPSGMPLDKAPGLDEVEDLLIKPT